MSSPGKVSSRKSVPALSDAQMARLGRRHHLVDSTRPLPTGPRKVNEAEIQDQNPKATMRLLNAVAAVMRQRMKVKSWGLERVPEEGVFITAATHVTQFDVFVPMAGIFYQGRRPRYMAKAELSSLPILGRWFRLVGMQSVHRRKGEARAIEEESIRILTSGRPLTIWPEGTLTRDPQKWPMTLKPGMAYIALETSRRLGHEVPLYCAVTWGAASINHFWPWPRKNVVFCFDSRLPYDDLLTDTDSWGQEPPKEAVRELTNRVRQRMENVMAEIRGEEPPVEGMWDYRTMSRELRPSLTRDVSLTALPDDGSRP